MYIAFLLLFSLVGAMVAFVTAGFAAIGDQAPQPEYNIAMGTATGLGSLICVVILTYYMYPKWNFTVPHIDSKGSHPIAMKSMNLHEKQ